MNSLGTGTEPKIVAKLDDRTVGASRSVFAPARGSADMDIERGQLIEIIVSVTAVGLFVAVLIIIGMRYNRDGLSADGGLVLVVAISVFVLAMAGIGLGLAYVLNPKEK